MSLFPLLMGLADELDNIKDDFGLGFYPHRHHPRVQPSLQLSLPADGEWFDERRSSRSRITFENTDITHSDDDDDDDDDDDECVNNETREYEKQYATRINYSNAEKYEKNKPSIEVTTTEKNDIDESLLTKSTQPKKKKKYFFKLEKKKSEESKTFIKVAVPTFDENKKFVEFKKVNFLKKSCVKK